MLVGGVGSSTFSLGQWSRGHTQPCQPTLTTCGSATWGLARGSVAIGETSAHSALSVLSTTRSLRSAQCWPGQPSTASSVQLDPPCSAEVKQAQSTSSACPSQAQAVPFCRTCLSPPWTIQFSQAQPSSNHLSPVQLSPDQPNSAQLNPAQPSSAQLSPAHPVGPAQLSPAQVCCGQPRAALTDVKAQWF